MVWNSAESTEYPNVRTFAQKKKLALIAAHDSILATQVKQMRDPNKRRQEVPFLENDLVYVSTKNIAFPKGLARKFIPKFIGPYKILRDFDNQSFRIELPSYLKQRGVRPDFHASLLRIHEPNDDRLFPGHLDTQLGDGPNIDREWAIEKIRSHYGSGTETIFEVEWKSGDVTWMSHSQIKNTPAVEDYLKLLNVQNVLELPKGKGSPPRKDPQIFLGAISYGSTPSSSLLRTPDLAINRNIIRSTSDPAACLINHEWGFASNPFFPSVNPTMSKAPAREISHPKFFRRSNTDYTVINLDHKSPWHVHVGQIMAYLAFDRALRDDVPVSKLPGIPLGYEEFATVFNSGGYPLDKRRLSTFIAGTSGSPDHIRKSTTSQAVSLHDFFITKEQCGLAPPTTTNTGLSAAHALVMEDYATTQAYKNKRRREAYEERQSQRESRDATPFEKTEQGNKKRKNQRKKPADDAPLTGWEEPLTSSEAFAPGAYASSSSTRLRTPQPYISLPKNNRNPKPSTTEDTTTKEPDKTRTTDNSDMEE
jgi:hypothetical protein